MQCTARLSCNLPRYEESDRHGKSGYEEEFLEHLEKIVRDLDRKINRGKERLRKSAEAKEKVGALSLSSVVGNELLPRNCSLFVQCCNCLFSHR